MVGRVPFLRQVWSGSVLNSLVQFEQFGTIRPICRDWTGLDDSEHPANRSTAAARWCGAKNTQRKKKLINMPELHRRTSFGACQSLSSLFVNTRSISFQRF